MSLSSYDYRVQLIRPLIAHVKEAIDCNLIEANASGPQPSFPFATYTIIDPFISIQFEDGENEPFESVISITLHDDSSLDVLNLATKLRKSFTTEANLRKFRELGIVIVSLEPTASRDNLITIDYERLAGFDLRIRTQDSFVDETKEPIDNINLGGILHEG